MVFHDWILWPRRLVLTQKSPQIWDGSQAETWSQAHTGTVEDPIPYVYGIDAEAGKYYSYLESTYLCKLTMLACIYPPNTPDMWQWEVVA